MSFSYGMGSSHRGMAKQHQKALLYVRLHHYITGHILFSDCYKTLPIGTLGPVVLWNWTILKIGFLLLNQVECTNDQGRNPSSRESFFTPEKTSFAGGKESLETIPCSLL